MASIEIGCLSVGRLFDSRPKVSLLVRPSIVMLLKRVFCPPALISPRSLSVWLSRGSVRA